VRDERGVSSLAEAVLIWPALLFAVMSIFQFGLMFYARNVAEQAAQQGAEAARAFNATSADGTAATNQFLDSVVSKTLQNRQVTATRTNDTASVTVTGTVISLVPGVHLKVSEHAEGLVERYVPPVNNGDDTADGESGGAP